MLRHHFLGVPIIDQLYLSGRLAWSAAWHGERPARNRGRLCYAYTESFSNLTNLGPIGIYRVYTPNTPILSMLGADECMQDAVEAWFNSRGSIQVRQATRGTL